MLHVHMHKTMHKKMHMHKEMYRKIHLKKRRQEIIKILEENPEISTLELSKIFSVSRSTISRDLSKLQRVAQGDVQDNAQKDAHAQDDTEK